MNSITARKKVLFLLLALSLFCGSQLLYAGTGVEYPEDIAARLQQKYDSMNSLTFTFNQRSDGQMSGRSRTGSGTAYFYKTGKTSQMRWDYTAPERQVLISDGITFSMYFEELKQMIVTPAESLDSDLTYTFFSGRGRIAEKFYILPPDPEYAGKDTDQDHPKIIKLVPQEQQSQVQSIHLWVTSDSLIRRIEILDHFDTVTTLNLSNLEANFLDRDASRSAAELFSFTAPEGTEIIRQ